jgi:hypothetical protein
MQVPWWFRRWFCYLNPSVVHVAAPCVWPAMTTKSSFDDA